jgi:chemotaxis signal transduction protein
MSQEFLSTTISQETLEKNLIAALNRLQHTVLDTELLGNNTTLADELPPEPFLGFAIGAYSFMVSAKCFCEVVVDTPIACLPNAPEYLVGLTNHRGVLVPVYQIHSALNSKLPKKNTIFCIGKGDSAIGILIDSLPTSFSLSAQQRLTSTASKNGAEAFLQPFVMASYLSNQTEWYLLDGNAFAGQLQTVVSQAHKFSSRKKNNYESARSREY